MVELQSALDPARLSKRNKSSTHLLEAEKNRNACQAVRRDAMTPHADVVIVGFVFDGGCFCDSRRMLCGVCLLLMEAFTAWLRLSSSFIVAPSASFGISSLDMYFLHTTTSKRSSVACVPWGPKYTHLSCLR